MMDENIPQKRLKIESLVQYTKESCSQNPAARLNEVKSQYKQLKRIFQPLQAKHMILENVKDVGEGNEEENLKKKLKECSQQNEEVKDQIEQKTKSISEMSERAQQMLEEYNEKQSSYQSLLEKIHAKRARVEEKENWLRNSDAMSDAAIEEIIKSSEDKMHTVQKQLESFKSLEMEWLKEIEKLTKEEKATEKIVTELENDVERNEKKVLERHTNSKVTRLSDSIEQISALQSIKVVSVKPTQIILHILSPDLKDTDREYVELTVDFKEDSKNDLRLSDAKVNVYSLNIGDILAEAVKTGSLLTLVHGVKSLWLKSYRLLSEVEKLREKYALDWLPDKGQVTVLYGEIMCTLKMTENYTNGGSISLVKVSGSLEKGRDIDGLLPTQTNPTLTDWLHYLQEILEPEKETKTTDC